MTVMILTALSSNPPAIAMAPSVSKAVATASPESTQSYEVLSGDTICKIAQQFHIDMDQLMELNPSIRVKYSLQGMKLKIPVNPPFNSMSQPVAAVEKQSGYTRSGKPLQFSKVLSCQITAYTAGPESTGKHPGDPGYGITFSGVKAQEGRTIAVDPQLVPLGSKVYIEGVGFRIAEDTGGAVKGEHIDLFLNNCSAAIEFGVQDHVKVYILN